MKARDLDVANIEWHRALRSLQCFQEKVDSEHWSTGAVGGPDKRRHIAFHVTLAAAKLARVEERVDHGFLDDSVLNDVIPDLLIYALQLTNLKGADLADLYSRRIAQIVSDSVPHNQAELREEQA